LREKEGKNAKERGPDEDEKAIKLYSKAALWIRAKKSESKGTEGEKGRKAPCGTLAARPSIA